MENLNTVAMFLLYSLILSLHISMTNSDRTCDCNEIDVLKDMMQNEVIERNLLKEFVQKEVLEQKKEVLEQKMESLRLHDKIRRMKATQRSIPTPAETTHLGFKDRIETIETDVADTNVKLNMLLNEQSEDIIYADVVKKGLESEKYARTEFMTEMKNQMAEIKGTVDTFKSELISSSEQCIANITATQEYFRQDLDAKLDETEKQTDLKFTSVTSDLNNIEQNLLEGKTNISVLNNIIMKDKIDGGWSMWGGWGSCTESCDGGFRSRSRTCSSPKPSLLGRYCEGSPEQTVACNKIPCADHKVAFSAHGVSVNSNQLVFLNVIHNFGDGYSSATGKFTCRVPGIYYFASTLTKRWGPTTNYVQCFLMVNGVNKLGAYENPYSSEEEMGGYSIPISSTLLLKAGDTVHIGSCYGASTLDNRNIFNSFTGILVTPDN